VHQTLKILWIDDDSPKAPEQSEGFTVYTAKSCSDALDLVASGPSLPDWVVVDLILPQGKWGDSYVMMPGLELIKHFNERYQSKVKLLAFSVVMTDVVRAMALEAGAQEAFAKTSKSWSQILETIRSLQARHSSEGVSAY
jgi:CheY-like chemotaxis protein